jgi:flagellar export protein FliJ
MRGFRLGAVLRARKANEDAAKSATATAVTAADLAAVTIRVRERDLDGRPVPDRAASAALAATLRARQAMAGALNDAISAAGLADAVVERRRTELTEATARRRAMEHLAERHAAALRKAEEAAEQAAADDLSGAAHHRARRSR